MRRVSCEWGRGKGGGTGISSPLDPPGRHPFRSGVSRFVTIARIDGMRTVHCVRAVFTALATIPGITTADVAIGRAQIIHDGRATPDAIAQAVSLVGYSVAETTEERQRSLPLL